MHLRARLKTIAAAVLVLGLCSGCATGTGDQAIAQPPAAAGPPPTYAYPLSGGDRLRVVVFGNPTLGGDYTVGGSGNIALPLIGEVEVSGLTSTQLQARIATRLADGYLKDPRVAVEVLTTRPFYILGEVAKPGEYPFANGLTLLGAVAQAGGFTYRATTRNVLIKHAGEAVEQAYTVTPTTMVAPGDVIRVRERWF